MFWVISVYFSIRNTLPKSGTFLLGHPVYIYIFLFLLSGLLPPTDNSIVVSSRSNNNNNNNNNTSTNLAYLSKAHTRAGKEAEVTGNSCQIK